MLDRFFTVLTITPSFLVRFWPVKCWIEALIMLYRMVKEWSVWFSFWSSQRFGQTLVNLGQTWSNLVKALRTLGNVSRTTFWGFFGMVDLSRVRNGSVKPWSTLGRPWSNLVKLDRISGNVPRTPFWGYLSWRAFVKSGRLGLGCLVLRADTRENLAGKNEVMTVWNHMSWYRIPNFRFCPL